MILLFFLVKSDQTLFAWIVKIINYTKLNNNMGAKGLLALAISR